MHLYTDLYEGVRQRAPFMACAYIEKLIGSARDIGGGSRTARSCRCRANLSGPLSHLYAQGTRGGCWGTVYILSQKGE